MKLRLRQMLGSGWWPSGPGRAGGGVGQPSGGGIGVSGWIGPSGPDQPGGMAGSSETARPGVGSGAGGSLIGALRRWARWLDAVEVEVQVEIGGHLGLWGAADEA